MKKIILTALLALFALVACSHDYTKTAVASTDEVLAYLNEKEKPVEGKVYNKTDLETVLNGLGDKKDSFLKAITVKKDNTEDKKFKEALTALKLTEAEFNDAITKLKATAKEKPKA